MSLLLLSCIFGQKKSFRIHRRIFKKYIFTKAYINLTGTILVPFDAGEGRQTNEFSGEQTSAGFPCSKPLSVHDHTIKAIAVED